MDALIHATQIVKKLQKAGHMAYFAGGWVRDYIMGHPSEDIDIATSAVPKEIMNIFSSTILVGLAFGVVIVVVEGHQFEVATFRKDLHYVDGRRPESIVLPGTPQDDAYRRDFTINGMFYDPLTHQIHDYIHGQEDIKRGVIRTIGDPHERFFEDRLRLLRAFRFAARFGFTIDVETQQAIVENADRLFPAVAMERIWQEFNKMSLYPRFDQALVDMHRLSVLEVIFPELKLLHLNDLRHLVSSYAHFPPNCPPIFYLMELFPSTQLEQKIEIAKRIKASNRDLKLLEFFDLLAETVKRDQEKGLIDKYPWVSLFANKQCQLCLEVIAARYSSSRRQAFLDQYAALFQQLKEHVRRVEEGKPLVSAALLLEKGVLPGKQMGILLKEAEKIAVSDDYQDPEPVLNKLFQLSVFKEKASS